VNFFDADGLASKDRVEISFLTAKADATATADDSDSFVERIIDIGQSRVGARGGLMDLGRHFMFRAS